MSAAAYSAFLLACYIAVAVVFFVAAGQCVAADNRAYRESLTNALAPCGTADIKAGSFKPRSGYRVTRLDSRRFTVEGPSGAVCTTTRWTPSVVLP